MIMKNSWFAEDLDEERGLGACDNVPTVVHKDYINGEQYEDILDVMQKELTDLEVRSDYEEGLLQSINLCIGMIGEPEYIQVL
jgi:hypothetical protein